MLNFMRLSSFTLIVASFINLSVYGKTIPIKTEDKKDVDIPVDFVKDSNLLLTLLKDLEAYDEKTGTVSPIKESIPLLIPASLLINIVDMIPALKPLVHSSEMLKHQRIIKDFKISRASLESLGTAIRNVLTWQKANQTANDIFPLLKALVYLQVEDNIITALAKESAPFFAKSASDFHTAIDDLKRIIIQNQTPEQFMALIKENAGKIISEDDRRHEERSFRIALNVHFPKEQIQSDPKAQYEKLLKMASYNIRTQYDLLPVEFRQFLSTETSAARKNWEGLIGQRVTVEEYWNTYASGDEKTELINKFQKRK